MTGKPQTRSAKKAMVDGMPIVQPSDRRAAPAGRPEPGETRVASAARPAAAARAVWWTVAWAAGFVALHGYWAAGGRIGFGDQTDPIPQTTTSPVGWVFTTLVAVMFLAGLAVPLALVQRWGRRIPRRALVVLMWAGAIILTARGGLGLLDGLARVAGIEGGITRLSYEQTLGSVHPSAYTRWSSAAIDFIFLVGGLLFGRAAALTGGRFGVE